MALLTRAGTINIPLPGAVPTTFDQTISVGFEPKLILFFWGTADEDGATAPEYGFGFGAAVAPGIPDIVTEGLVDSAYLSTGSTEGGTTPTALTYANRDTSVTIFRCNATGFPEDPAGGVVQSFSSTGFTLRWVVESIASPLVVNYLALGGSDIENVCIRQCRVPASNSSKSFTGCGFQPDSVLVFGARGASAVTGGSYACIGMANATSQASVTLSENYADVPTTTSCWSKQLSTTLLQYLSSTTGASVGEGSLTSFDADGFTMNFTGLTSAASTYFWAICLKGMETDILSITQPTTAQTQTVSSAVNAQAALFLSTGKVASTSATSHAQIAIGAVSAPGVQAAVWADDKSSVSPQNGFREYSNYALRLWKNTDRVNAAAAVSTVALNETNIALTWSSVDTTARQVFAFLFGGLAGSSDTSSESVISSSESPYYCYNQFINSTFDYDFVGWGNHLATVLSDKTVRLYAEYADPAYVEQSVSGLVPATAGTLSVQIQAVHWSSPAVLTAAVYDASNGSLLASASTSTTGLFEVSFIVPASGYVRGRISAVVELEGTFTQIDIDDVELFACSYLTSSSITLSSSYTPDEPTSSLTSSSSSLTPTTCIPWIGDSFARSSASGLGYTDGLSTNGITYLGGDGIVWEGDAAPYLSIIGQMVVRPFGSLWPETMAYVDAGYCNGTLTSAFQLHTSSLVKAAGFVLRVVDDNTYTHVHITQARIQILKDGVTEIASTAISPYLPLDTRLIAVIQINGNLATVTIWNGTTTLASLSFTADYNVTATKFGIRVLNSTAGTFYDYFYFDNCNGYSSLGAEFSSSLTSSYSSLTSSSSYVYPESSLSSSLVSSESYVSSSSLTVFDEVGRQQVAVDQNQGGTRFPFVDPSDDLDILIGDLYLRYQDHYCQLEQPFKVAWLSGFGTLAATNPTGEVHRYDVAITDAQDRVVFDSRDAFDFSINTWAASKLILQWTTSDDEILRLTLYRTWAIGETPRNWPRYFEPLDARLDPRTYERVVSQVTELRVGTALVDTSGDVVIPAGSPVVWQAGYNSILDVQSQTDVDGTRRVTNVLLEAVPGAGLGQYPGCDAVPVLRRINGVTADDAGNLRLDAAECYRLEQPILESDPEAVSELGPLEYTYLGGTRNIRLNQATLKISNDCGPCCECDDFVNVYEAIRRVSNRYAELGRRAEAVRDQYKENIDRWNAQKSCRQANLLQMALLPIGSCRLAVAASLCNGTTEPLLDGELTLDFSASTIAGCVLCGTTYRRGNVDPYRNIPPSQLMPYKLGGEWPLFTASFDCINEGENGYVTFVLQLPGCTASDIVALTVSASAAGGANPGGATPISWASGLIVSSDSGSCCETGE
jgi:hypothetical protein